MRLGGTGPARAPVTAILAILALCAALLVACGGGPHASLPATIPSGTPPSEGVASAPATQPPASTPAPTSPDALGATRVIPVPKSLAQSQLHRLMAVDGQTVLLDAEAGRTKRPLLVVLHGLGEDAAEMRRQTGFTALAALDGFDVVYPNAPQDPAAQLTSVLTTASSQAPGVSPSLQSAISTPTPSSSVSPSVTPSPSPTPSRAQPSSSSPSSSKPTPTPKPIRTTTPTPTPAPTVVRTSPPPPPLPTRSPSKRPVPKKSKPRTVPKKKRPSPIVPGTRAWNAGMCCAVQTRNDVVYLVHVVQSVTYTVPIDLQRVYVVGFSNGGMMALRAVCSAPGVFAAAGSVSGPFLGTACARPVWRHVAAASDPVVPPAGGIPVGVPDLGVVKDWCGCSFPATTTETARFGPYASVLVNPTGGHSWPTPDNAAWPFDPERDLWNYVSRFHI